MRDKAVCFYHGGKAGGPKGEANGRFKHGHETKEAIAARQRSAALLGAIRTDAAGNPVGIDWELVPLLLKALKLKETRALKRARNKAAWNAGDRRAWGGEDRQDRQRL